MRTAIRYLRALERAGEPLYEEIDGRRKVWRLMPSARHETITLTTSQMVALFLSRRVFDFLAGTGFKEDLDDVFAQLEATLKRKDFAAARNLDRKIFDVNEAPHIYEERIEDVNDIVTALLREERLRVSHDSVGRRRRIRHRAVHAPHLQEGPLPRRAAASTTRALRTFALDGFRDVDWLRGDRFDYPGRLPARAGRRGRVRSHPRAGADARADPVRRQGRALRGAGHVAPDPAVQAHGGRGWR